MNEGDSMDSFLTKIKDLKEQLIAVDEILPNSSLVQTVLNGLPDSYQSFASTLRLMMKGDPNTLLLFEELVTILLQEDQSRQNRSIMRVVDQDFIASQRGKGKAASLYSKPKSAGAGPTKKADKDEKKTEKKLQCNYCKAVDHVIKDCPKIAAKEAKKKEANIAVVDASPSKCRILQM